MDTWDLSTHVNLRHLDQGDTERIILESVTVTTLTKADIAQKVANDCGFMKGEANEILEKLVEIIKASLVSGEDVMVSGLRKWSVKSKHARRGRNPHAGETLTLSARRVVTWKYSAVLKDAVNRLR